MERRKNLRIHAYRPVRLQSPRGLRLTETLTKDLSVGGLCCISSEPYPVMTEMNLELVLSTGDGPLPLRGKLAWFRMIPHSDQFDLGFSFIELTPQTKRRLSAYLDHLAQQAPLISV